jgi:hypothetical protein
MGELSDAGGGLPLSSSTFLLCVFENGRRHLKSNRGAGAGSVSTDKGDCASRRLGMLLLMAMMYPQASLLLSSNVEESWAWCGKTKIRSEPEQKIDAGKCCLPSSLPAVDCSFSLLVDWRWSYLVNLE